jgi:hypothetical protein
LENIENNVHIAKDYDAAVVVRLDGCGMSERSFYLLIVELEPR